jgi:hypothetical protein
MEVLKDTILCEAHKDLCQLFSSNWKRTVLPELTGAFKVERSERRSQHNQSRQVFVFMQINKDSNRL